MTKKTFETLKKNPIILLWFAIPFVCDAIITLLENAGSIYSSSRLYSFSIFKSNYFSLIGSVILIVALLTWLLLLYPAISRYIYWTVDEKPRENWFARSLKGYWWRLFAMQIIYAAFVFAISLPMIILLGIINLAFGGIKVFFIGYCARAILFFMAIIFYYIGIAAAYAEDQFGTAISNIFKAGKRYFLGSLPLLLRMIVPIIIMAAVIVINEMEKALNIFTIIIYIWGWLFNAFFSVYCMHCYVGYKKHMEKVAQIMNFGIEEVNE
ncbi:MAG: hypothetical protein AB1Z23_13140 [Eubacteriales bacterium]